MNNCVASRFFASIPSMIRQIVKINDVVDRFLWKPYWFIPKNFLDFRSKTIRKKSILILSSHCSKSDAFVVLSDFRVDFLGEGKDAAFRPCLYGDLFIHCIAKPKKYVVPSIGLQTFFVQAFKIVVDSWKVIMLLLYILWDDWPIFMISGLNQQLQQQLEYTLLNPDCHSWWISKMQSGLEDTLEERYPIKFCCKLGKMPQKRMEYFRLLLKHLAWIEHQLLSGIRDSWKAKSLWGMMRGVGGVRKSIHQSWLAKELGLGLLCWGFKGVPERDYLTKMGINIVPQAP